MFITDSVPLNQRFQFTEYRRFNSVILIDTPIPDDEGTAFELVRQAEGEKTRNHRQETIAKKKKRVSVLISSLAVFATL